MSIENPIFLGLHTWTSTTATPDLRPGDIVTYESKPFRVLELRERDLSLWDERFTGPWEQLGRPDPATWRCRPMVIMLRDDLNPDAEPLHGVVRADRTWTQLPGHYVICPKCGEIPPCREVRIINEMAKAGRRADQVMSLVPGACHHCGMAVTTRHKAYRFAGPNLVRPDFPDGTAVFHGKKRPCLSAAFDYDEKWALAEPGRRRRFYCEGTETKHADGSIECTEGDACPGDPAHHRGNRRHDAGWTEPGACWCVSGDLAGRIEQQMRDGEVRQ